jgi:hypothetical protein
MNKLMTRLGAGFGSVAVLFVLSGCATHTALTVPTREAESYGIRAEVERCAIGAEVFNTEEKSKIAFDANLPEEGLLPVRLVLDNKGNKTLTLMKSRILLLDRAGNRYGPLPAETAAYKVGHSVAGQAVGWGIVFGVIGAGVAGYQADKANKERARDYMNKELRDSILLPGQMASGFLYFDVGKGNTDSLLNYSLQISLLEEKTGVNHKVDLRLQ